MKVCIYGQMHNGKTTYANMLHQEILKQTGIYYYLGAWAAPIKAIVCEKYLMTLDFINEWKNKKEVPPNFNVTMREVLQKEGESSRECMTDVWVKYLMHHYTNINLIVDDGRYPNEAEAICKDGGYNIVIIRPDHINDSPHPSEAKIGGVVKAFMNKTHNPPEWTGLIHEVVMNNEGIDELKKVVYTTVRNILKQV